MLLHCEDLCFAVFMLVFAQLSINIVCFFFFSFFVDVVYDPEIILALIGMLQKLSTCRAGRKAPEVFIASTIRNPDTYQLFQAELGGCLLQPLFNGFAFCLFPQYLFCGGEEQEHWPRAGSYPRAGFKSSSFCTWISSGVWYILAITAHICEGWF